MTFAALMCNHCSRPIPLPAPKHPGKPPRQQLWPRDAQTRNFLCPHCKRVSAYPCTAPCLVRVENTAQEQPRRGHIVVCIEVSCGATGCEAPIKIHTLVASDADPQLEVRRIFSQSTTDRIGCGKAHYLEGPLQTAKILNAYFDWKDWEVL